MARYNVLFLKTVCGDTGNEVEAPQGSFEVEAENDTAAAASAKLLFASERGIADWSIHSDRFIVERLAVPHGMTHQHRRTR